MSGGVPARVDGTAKAVLLGLIDDAAEAGWTLDRVCVVLGMDRRRAWRWQRRRTEGTLDDVRPGGRAVHGLLSSERDEIVGLFDEWGDTDRSHRKLAHRGSYLGRVWVSPSTVDRVLAGHGLALARTPRPARTAKTPWPSWCEWRPNQLWCWDGTVFPTCRQAKHAYAIVDVVSRKWIATHHTAAPDSVAARVLFAKALHSEGLLTGELSARLDNPDADLPHSDTIPLLLAVSDNGPEMRSGDTARFMAMCSIAQHFGRPSTPTDQAWIESLFSHVKGEHPHLETLGDPADLTRELERVRGHYNSVRLHEGIGYVTPPPPPPPPPPPRRAHRQRRPDPPSTPRRSPTSRRATTRPPPKPAVNMTNQPPPHTRRCGLKKPAICREESETPQSPRARGDPSPCPPTTNPHRPPKTPHRNEPPPHQSHQICCSQEVPPHMSEMPAEINSILPCQEAFLTDPPHPQHSPHRWIQA